MKYTISYIQTIIEEEGLSATILDHVSPSRVKDTELSVLFEEARDVLIRIQEYIDNNSGSDEGESDEDEDEFDDN
jgi:hypothetical protein